MPQKQDDDFSFEIIESIGEINVNQRGWNKELNFVRWNANPPKYDIRDWHPDHGKMSRGITLTEEELIQLGRLIAGRYPDVLKCAESQNTEKQSTGSQNDNVMAADSSAENQPF